MEGRGVKKGQLEGGWEKTALGRTRSGEAGGTDSVPGGTDGSVA